MYREISKRTECMSWSIIFIFIIVAIITIIIIIIVVIIVNNKNENDTPTHTFSSLTDFFLHIRSPSFAVSAHTLQSLIYRSSSPCPVPSCQWSVDGFLTPVDVFSYCGGTKNVCTYCQKRHIFIITPWSRVLLDKLTVTLQLVKKFPTFMELESSSPYSQEPATCPFYGCVILPLETLPPPPEI
jgi:hypothetical protein